MKNLLKLPVLPVCVFMALCCVAPLSLARDAQEAVSAVLYPATRTWQSVADAPAIPPERIAAIREKLRAAYLASITESQTLEGPGCSFIGRVLEGEGGEALAFHSLDVDGDGVPDVVYAGSALCAEGEATFVWFGSRAGFSARKDSLWQMRALRVSPGGEMISSVAPGCCGDPVDQYFLGNLENMRRFASTRITQETVLPKGLLAKPRAFRKSIPTKLRSAPELKDRYDFGRSEFMRHAVFGNILRHYLPGLSGTVLARQTDLQGRRWSFVIVNDMSAPFLLQAPFAVDAGWVAE